MIQIVKSSKLGQVGAHLDGEHAVARDVAALFGLEALEVGGVDALRRHELALQGVEVLCDLGEVPLGEARALQQRVDGVHAAERRLLLFVVQHHACSRASLRLALPVSRPVVTHKHAANREPATCQYMVIELDAFDNTHNDGALDVPDWALRSRGVTRLTSYQRCSGRSSTLFYSSNDCR